LFSLLTKGGLSARFKAVTGIEIAISRRDLMAELSPYVSTILSPSDGLLAQTRRSGRAAAQPSVFVPNFGSVRETPLGKNLLMRMNRGHTS